MSGTLTGSLEHNLVFDYRLNEINCDILVFGAFKVRIFIACWQFIDLNSNELEFMSKTTRAWLKTMSATVSSSIPETKFLSADGPPLKYKVIAKCSTTKARVGVMTLRHGEVDTPVFMPVGTKVCLLFRRIDVTGFNRNRFCFAGNIERRPSRPTLQSRLSNYIGEYVSFRTKAGKNDESKWILTSLGWFIKFQGHLFQIFIVFVYETFETFQSISMINITRRARDFSEINATVHYRAPKFLTKLAVCTSTWDGIAICLPIPADFKWYLYWNWPKLTSTASISSRHMMDHSACWHRNIPPKFKIPSAPILWCNWMT